MIIEYSSNNSGGSWWLTDQNWHDLEAAGWTVAWENGRWLGALAKKAHKDFPSVKDAILEWEKITKQTASDEGCNCCGAPHTFYWGRATSIAPENSTETYGYASGEDCLQYLYDEVKNRPSNLRDALELIRKGDQP